MSSLNTEATKLTDLELREAIIKTIAFFDLFDWPLTAREIKKNFAGRASLSEVIKLLDKELGFNEETEEKKSAKVIDSQDGFYFLSGRSAIIAIRQQRYNYFVRKLKIARRFARVFSFFPFVQKVYLSNVIGSYNLRDGSDIDFLVVTTPQRLWLSRLYCAGLAKILNRRPTPSYKRDTICLSFYMSADYQDWHDLRLIGDDPYFDYWRNNLVLLYNRDRQYNFIKFLDKLGNLLEVAVKKLQLKIMPSYLRTAINNSDGVVVNDSVLKFYIHDRRREYADKYAKKIQEIFSAIN
ncbi:hypothetical protein GW920_02655 [Candidatus Falkowbacteria bacterium]|uniref:Polymerase nucleotidyl transferase domain-containing protein n=1 Tax=Candidatus Falkowbacteria bacterium CG10_big_fil_rev_8_21_14_0_10_37_18 TaxID=1974562 RepID=A0A2H0VAG3_9BACT|nr:hypothetical protein [Candidatus Falkowbacteria bacterium]NCQ12624.1 hypothetical protein [Candidatus Falkowbacteria bacterium]OIO05762.1 MAG: hypothetical protein AUJ26_02370 [Candidatus Falkowbacteria bacterium CG1_02_37_21]PIR95310.1 MAG: hypothetical protein COT93_03110 [Candidatus Falkowbacteria bacterium CG10_big_fil_rev_8_21_14_0_10_37_18]